MICSKLKRFGEEIVLFNTHLEGNVRIASVLVKICTQIPSRSKSDVLPLTQLAQF